MNKYKFKDSIDYIETWTDHKLHVVYSSTTLRPEGRGDILIEEIWLDEKEIIDIVDLELIAKIEHYIIEESVNAVCPFDPDTWEPEL